MIAGRDWREMSAAEFDSAALESCQLALMPAPDPCGTGDLLDMLEDDSGAPMG